MTELTLVRQDAVNVWSPRGRITAKRAGETVRAFLDTATTSFGRATHYNTRQEQQAAELKAHEGLMKLDRDLYAVFMGLPGVTDRARQIGLKKLLSTSREGQGTFLDDDDERAVLYHLIHNLPPQRMLKLIDAFRLGNEELGLKRANNARTRKLILRTLLSTPRIQLWAVKYRTKMQRALTHAWGQRMTSIVKSILSKAPTARTAKENSILKKQIARYANTNLRVALESVGFLFGIRDRLSLPLFKAFVDAKGDLGKGKTLPAEVLEGIRSTYHKDSKKEKIIALTKDTMTKGQKLAVQKRAKAAGIKVDIDPLDYDSVKLYIYAFEQGMTKKIRDALATKAEMAAKKFPAQFETIGVLVDASASMFGDKTQALRPMAATLSLRDMLVRTAKNHRVVYAGGEFTDMVRPAGDTSLADGLVEVLESAPDAVFVVSDGYENSPAGRFAEVVDQVREIGIETPIYHLNPVFAAEASGVRELSTGKVPTLPVRDPSGLGTTFVRGMIEADPIRGINTLVRMALTAGPIENKVLTA